MWLGGARVDFRSVESIQAARANVLLASWKVRKAPTTLQSSRYRHLERSPPRSPTGRPWHVGCGVVHARHGLCLALVRHRQSVEAPHVASHDLATEYTWGGRFGGYVTVRRVDVNTHMCLVRFARLTHVSGPSTAFVEPAEVDSLVLVFHGLDGKPFDPHPHFTSFPGTTGRDALDH